MRSGDRNLSLGSENVRRLAGAVHAGTGPLKTLSRYLNDGGLPIVIGMRTARHEETVWIPGD